MNVKPLSFVLGGSLLAAVTCVIPTVSAHHSFAAYNMTETRTVEGTLKRFRWGAPHSSLILYYQDDSGEKQQMSMTSGSPLMFSKAGFNPRDFKSGDKITVVYHPNVNGAPGGALSSLTLENGKTFSDTEAASNTTPATDAGSAQ